jgi:Protein kinase domain
VTPERWGEVTALFGAVVDAAADDREARLAEAAARDPELVAEVRSLLAHHESGQFLEQPAWTADPSLLDGSGPLVGSHVGQYQVLAELGRGGMGIVYAAEDERLRRAVALKALPPEYARDADRRARLTREARAAAGLSHPCIATVYALEDIDGDLYISSELVPGRTLRQELANGPLREPLLGETLVAIASALEAAHAIGIVHRDLKPENVMRRVDGQVKVLDFGLAREVPGQTHRPRLTADALPMGTPGYAAPEQWSSSGTDARVDIFAFGVLAWELGTGEHPFGQDPARSAARMAAFLQGLPTTARRPPAPIEAIARRCMRGNPDERYPTATALLADLRQGSEATGAGRPPARWWWWQFHQVAVAAADTTLAAVILATRGAYAPTGGRAVWVTGLVLATLAVTLRLHLVFLSNVHPEAVPERRHVVFRWIAASEMLLALLIAAVVTLLDTDGHDGVAAVLVTLAVGLVVSLLAIEPATTAAAHLDRQPTP